jgi:hypothetical protein
MIKVKKNGRRTKGTGLGQKVRAINFSISDFEKRVDRMKQCHFS